MKNPAEALSEDDRLVFRAGDARAEGCAKKR
jgi:hypothetical protein